MRHRDLPIERIRSELRKTWLLAILLSAAGGIWAVDQLIDGVPQADLLVLFTSLAALGCGYGMSSFPPAARMPLLLFAVPFSVALILSPSVAHIGVGITLLLVTLLTLRLVNLQDRGLVEPRPLALDRRQRAGARLPGGGGGARREGPGRADRRHRSADRAGQPARLPGGARGPARRRDRPPTSLALFDLDGFKPVNDTFGHAAGDAVLIEVANRLEANGGAEAFAARIGGDEFALIFPCAGEAEAAAMGEWLCGVLGRGYRVQARELRISACCGLVLLARAGPTSPPRSIAATPPCTAASRGAAAASPCTAPSSSGRTSAGGDRQALRSPDVHAEFSLVYQPIFDLATGAIRSFEALARWEHARARHDPPSEFIPITEQINVIEEISDALLDRAAGEAAGWPDTVHLSFNLSAVQLLLGHLGAAHPRHPAVARPGARPAASRGHRNLAARRFPDRAPISTGCAPPARASCSTISAPATPRSPTSGR